MILFAYIALLGWVPFVVVLFAAMPARTAAATALVGAWLLLPPIILLINGLPDYSKNTAATVGIVLGTLIFDPVRFTSFRPRWFDLPMLLYCFSGLFSSLQNNLGVYDGLSDALDLLVVWGLPYLLGRLYFGDPDSLRYFAVAMTIGGLAYVLPCLWEIRMSPHLMRTFYGVGFWQGTRMGGYRPNVFFYTGLELGLWMTAASLAGWWLWCCGAIKKIGQWPFGSVLLPILMITTILCRSTGALVLLAFGMMVLWLSVRLRTRLLLACVLLIGPIYVAIRVPNVWSGQQAVDLAERLLTHDRAFSLSYRLMCENLLVAKAVEQPVFGWGKWGGSHAYFSETNKRVEMDGLWIILLGTKGFVGLTLFYLAMALPAALFVWRFPPRTWGHPQVAAGSLAAVLLALYLIDCLMNGFQNVIYMALAGGLIAVEPKQFRTTIARIGGTAVGQGEPRAAALSAQASGPSPRPGQTMMADRYRALGRSFKQEGRLNEAEPAWRHALDVLTGLLEAEPGSAELRRLWCDCANDLAWLWANHPDPIHRNPEAAVAMARRMVAQCPHDEVYWNTLGAAHYRAGDDASAIAALDHAKTLGGCTAFDEIFLGMAHLRMGDHEGARTELSQAVVRAEQDYPGHPEMTVFCHEARSMLAHESGSPTPAL